MNKIFSLTGNEISRRIASKEMDPAGTGEFFKQRAVRVDKSLNSFVNIFDQPVFNDGQSILSGAPIAIKDNICIKGKNVTCSSRILKNYISPYDATVIEKLRQAGLTFIGSTNMDEFAFGSSTENSCYGPTKNPWDLRRVPGGSSGGSAAAVASRLVPCALGSDTGGSIRQPACFCGVVGFKPTYGRVSRYGLVAFGSSLDQIGPITVDFADCAALLNIICGFDPRDTTSARVPVPDFTLSLGRDIKGVKLGVPREFFGPGLSNEVREAIDRAVDILKQKGAEVIEVSLPNMGYAVAAYYIIACSEASSNLQRYDGVKYGLRVPEDNLIEQYKVTRGQGFGPEVKRRIFLGTYSLSSGYYDAYYLRALKVRTLIKNDFIEVFKKVDALITPTAPTPAFCIGEKSDDPLSMYLSDIYTISVNLAGVPAVSLPCGFSSENLPLGLQFIGRHFDEETLISLGSAYQSASDYHLKLPGVADER